MGPQRHAKQPLPLHPSTSVKVWAKLISQESQIRTRYLQGFVFISFQESIFPGIDLQMVLVSPIPLFSVVAWVLRGTQSNLCLYTRAAQSRSGRSSFRKGHRSGPDIFKDSRSFHSRGAYSLALICRRCLFLPFHSLPWWHGSSKARKATSALTPEQLSQDLGEAHFARVTDQDQRFSRNHVHLISGENIPWY